MVSTLQIKPSKVSGNIAIPPSKSQTMRALLFGMLSQGTTLIDHFLPSPDTEAMIRALGLFGATVTQKTDRLIIEGGFGPAENIIDAGNSGIILRFLGGLSGLLPTYTLLTGDRSIRERRSVKPLLEGLKQLGAFAESSHLNEHPPLIIKGPIQPGKLRIDGQDSQPVSAFLIATSFLEGPSEIIVDHPGETPWIALTLHWLETFGARITHDHFCHYYVPGKLKIPGFYYPVPGDFSTALFPAASALVTQSSLVLTHLNFDDPQGDKLFFDIIEEMGAQVSRSKHSVKVAYQPLKGCTIDVNPCIDALPVLAVLGCYASGITELCNGAVARFKESDRISAMACELKKMGAHIEERKEGLVIHQSCLKGAQLESHGDHRVALALAVAALGAEGPSEIHGIECIAKTYPHFVAEFTRIGADFELGSFRI